MDRNQKAKMVSDCETLGDDVYGLGGLHKEEASSATAPDAVGAHRSGGGFQPLVAWLFGQLQGHVVASDAPDTASGENHADPNPRVG